MATIKDLLSSMIAKIHTKVDKEDFEALGDNMFTVDLEGAPEGDGEIVLLNADLLGGKAADNFATKDYVSAKIADAQLGGGENGDIDLSGFMLKTDTAVNSNKLGGKDPEYYLSPWLTGTTEEITPMQVYQALLKEQNVMITYPNSPFGAIAFTGFGVVGGLNIIAATEVLQVEGDVAQCQLVGNVDNTAWNFEITTIPTTSQMASLTAEDVGALPSTGIAADSAKLGGKAPEYYLTPVNLLDNSNLLDPVNQRGYTNDTTVENTYFIDRWSVSGASSFSLGANGMEIKSGFCHQIVSISKIKSGHAYTLACKINGNILCYNGVAEETIGAWEEGLVTIYYAGQGVTVYLTKAGATYEWVALYEGSYTAETLPPYVPKGYSAELLECQRYYYKFQSGTSVYGYTGSGGTSIYLAFELPTIMRLTNPTVSMSSNIYGAFGGAGATSLTNISSSKTMGKQFELVMSLSSSASPNTVYAGWVNGTITVSADL